MSKDDIGLGGHVTIEAADRLVERAPRERKRALSINETNLPWKPFEKSGEPRQLRRPLGEQRLDDLERRTSGVLQLSQTVGEMAMQLVLVDVARRRVRTFDCFVLEPFQVRAQILLERHAAMVAPAQWPGTISALIATGRRGTLRVIDLRTEATAIMD
jgi:hypothetical protein